MTDGQSSDRSVKTGKLVDSMSMVDDTKRPIRSDELPTRGPMAASQQGRPAGNDPLAELARLIGQEDPFREMEREARALRRREAPPIAAEPAAAEWAPQVDNLGQTPRASVGERRFSRSTSFSEPAAARPAAQVGESSGATYTEYEVEHDAEGDIPLDEEDEDMLAPRRRGGLRTLMSVIAIAMLGAAGVYGYYLIGGPAAPSPAPVIKAQTEPAKIIPSPQSQAPDSPAKIYDRVGDRGQSDKLVPREEQPLNVKEVVGSTGPRIAPPATQTPAPIAAATTGSLVQPNASSEPKKVKTIAIRPDLSIAPTSAANTRQAAVLPPAPIPTQQPRPVQTTVIAPQQAVPAPATPAPAPSAPTQTASIPPAADLGGYLVQVSSQRSEADAQASFRALQGKFPSLLGGWQPIIRRAELGDRGTFYRAQIGPFATAEQAQDVCGSLKAAGGQCIVQKN